jgi:hypothetical protein
MIARLTPVAAALAAVSLGFPEQAEKVPPPQHAAFTQQAASCVDSRAGRSTVAFQPAEHVAARPRWAGRDSNPRP